MYAIDRLRMLSSSELTMLGVHDVAYVKPVTVAGEKQYAVHAADGTEIAVIEERDIAVAAVRQYDREPVSVH